MNLRNILFQIHMWIGLAVGIFFILLGLSGSVVVYGDAITRALSPAAPKASAAGTPLPLEQIIAAARAESAQSRGRAAQLTLPAAAGDPVIVRFNAQRGPRPDAGGRGEGRGAPGGRRGGPDGFNRAGAEGARPPQQRVPPTNIFVDPVSGQVLGTQPATQPALVAVSHEMHEAMLLGQPGRTFVGWLGVGMVLLGLSGPVLWWPKRGQWKYAFGVRGNARGFRLYREIHGMVGIWAVLVFLFVCVTGTAIAFPGLAATLTGQTPQREGPPPGFAPPAALEVPDNATPQPLARLIAAAAQTQPGSSARGLTVPAESNRPVSVLLTGAARPVSVNPYTGAVLASGQPQAQGGIPFRSWHQGEGFGPVWQFLLFLTGLLPLIFVVTGVMMWLKKRQNRGKPAAA